MFFSSAEGRALHFPRMFSLGDSGQCRDGVVYSGIYRAMYLGAFSEDQVTCLDFPFGGFKATSKSFERNQPRSRRFQSFQNPFSRDRDRANVASIIIRFYIDAIRKAFEGPVSKGPKNPWPKKGGQPVTGMGVAGSVIRIEGGLPENSDSIPTLQHQIA
jgi:hypothetical protein